MMETIVRKIHKEMRARQQACYPGLPEVEYDRAATMLAKTVIDGVRMALAAPPMNVGKPTHAV